MRGGADDDGIRAGKALNARGDVRRVAHREPLGAIGAAHIAHDRHACMHADAHGQRHRPFRTQARAQFGDGVENLNGGLDRAPSIIFVRNGIAEVHEDAVAVELRDRAFVTADGAGRRIAIVRDDFAQIFRVDRLRQLGGPDQVAEHERHVPAFDRRAHGGCRRWRGRELRAAIAAEPGVGRMFRAARRAARRERRPALRAEFCSGRRYGAAPLTRCAHSRGSGR